MDTEESTLPFKRIKLAVRMLLRIEWLRNTVGGVLIAAGAPNILSGFFGINMCLGVTYYDTLWEFILEFIVGICLCGLGIAAWLFSDS